jgi:hypothetical protein
MTSQEGRGKPAPDILVLLHDRIDELGLPAVKLSLTDHVRVPFRGSRGGEGPLTIAQATTLTWVTNPAFPTRMVEWPLSLPEGTTIDDIATALGILMARHESLRTSYPPGYPPVQRVAQSGELVVDVYQASNLPADDAVLITELAGLLRSREFDLAAELQLRVAVATCQGMPRAAVILYSHMAVDMHSMVVLDRQLTTLLTDPSSRQVGPLAHQPLDQAAREASARGRRMMDAAVRGRQAVLRTMPQCLYAVPSADPGHDGGMLSGWLWSRAGALALPHTEARTGTSPQLVVLAALCTMIAWRTGHDECALAVLSSNRHERHLRDFISSQTLDSVVSVDVRAQGFDEVVRRTGAAVVRGSRNSLLDVTVLDRIIEEVEHERGITLIRYCTYNDISVFQSAPEITDTAADAADIGEALHQTRFASLPVPGAEEQLLKLVLQQVAGELIAGVMTRDANRVPLGEIETLLRGTEALLVAAASGDVELSRLGEITSVWPVIRDAGWLRIGSSWVELAEVQRLVRDAMPTPAMAFAVPGPAGEPELAAYLTAGGSISTPEQAHAACLATLAGTRTLAPPDGIRYTAMTPGRYIICASAPGDPSDLAAWRRQPVVADGDGRRRG